MRISSFADHAGNTPSPDGGSSGVVYVQGLSTPGRVLVLRARWAPFDCFRVSERILALVLVEALADSELKPLSTLLAASSSCSEKPTCRGEGAGSGGHAL